MLRDPVCGMEFSEEEQKFATEYKGKKFYFCSYTCQSEFEKDPENHSALSEPLKVTEIMNAEAEFVDFDSTVLEVAKRMSSKGHGCMLVVEGGRVVGIITEHDLVGRVLAEGVSPSKLRAKDIMTTPLIAVGPQATVEEASKTMSQYSIRRLPVVKGGVLIGLVTATDIAMQMAKERKFKDNRLNAIAKYCVSPAAGPYE